MATSTSGASANGGTVGSLVVPLDGSQFSARALPVALELATRIGASIEVVSVVANRETLEERVRELASVSGAYSLPGEPTVLVEPKTVDAIIRFHAERPESVVCMATHGRGRTAALLGSIASDFVDRTRHPLVAVGPMAEPPLEGDVVACVDDSSMAPELVRVASVWAQRLGRPLAVMTVAEPVPPPVTSRPAQRRFGPDGDVESYLDELVAPWRRRGDDVETSVVYDPISPSEGVRSFLEERPASLLVTGTRARRGIARLALGSVSSRIVHASTAPVLIVPPG